MSMLNDSIREFLNGRHYATLATQNEDGSIHLTPVWYLFEDERFFVSGASSGRKFKNVVHRPGVSLMVDSRRKQGDEQWLSVSGNAEIISGKKSDEIHYKIVNRYITEAGMEEAGVGGVFLAAADLTISIEPDSLRSWELKELDEQYFGGILGQTPDKWFHQID